MNPICLSKYFTLFLGRQRRPYCFQKLVFVWLHVRIYVYICQDGGAMGFVDFTKLSFALSSLAQPNEKYYRIPFCNTKPAQTLRRTFSKRNSRKKNKSDNKMAALEASVHPVRNHLCYHFFLYQTNESCSQSVSKRRMLLKRFNNSCFRVTATNATEAERPFYERSA